MSELHEVTPAEVAAMYGQPYVEPVSAAEPETPAPVEESAPTEKDPE